MRYVTVGEVVAINAARLDAVQDEIVALAVDVAEGILDVTAIAGRLKGWTTPLAPEDET